MNEKKYEVWKSPSLVKNYLSGIRIAFPCAFEQIDVMLKLIELNTDNIDRVLDIGCGEGILGAAVIEKYPNSNGVFIDFSDDMLGAAKIKLKDFSDRTKFMNVDYGNKNWMESVKNYQPYDVIVSGFSIHHQPDQRKVEIYEDIYTLLNNGGIFINIEHVLSATKWVENVHDEHFIDSLYNYELMKETNKSRLDVSKGYYKRVDKEANILAPVEKQCSWLTNIGFKDVDCYFKVFELAVFGGRKY